MSLNGSDLLLFRIEDIGRNSKNIVVTGTEIYIHLLLALRNSAFDIENIQTS